MKAAADALRVAEKSEVKTKQAELMTSAESVLGEWLDKNQGSTVTENSIFADLPKFYEEEFNKDMKQLNVRICYHCRDGKMGSSLRIFSANVTYHLDSSILSGTSSRCGDKSVRVRPTDRRICTKDHCQWFRV